MSPPPTGIAKIIGQTAAGENSATEIEIEALGRTQRSSGLVGDTARPIVNAEDLWPKDWDLSKAMSIVIGEAGQTVTLGGYYLAGTAYITPGRDVSGGPAVMRQAALSLVTVIDRMHEGRGGLIQAGTLNRLGRDGLPDQSDSDYKTMQELVQIAAGVITGPSTAWNLSLTIVNSADLLDGTPGGPLDWTNVRAIPELVDLLGQIGWTGSLTSDGTTLRIHRLPQPGETLTLPSVVTTNALPYRLDDAPANRSRYIIVTSGRTRTTVLTKRDIDDLEWVYFDERTNAWLNQTEHDLLYPSEIGPSDIAALKAGPDADLENAAQLNRVFAALRLVDQPGEGRKDLRTAGRFVVLPGEFDFGGKRMSGTPAFIEAKFCVETADGQFTNDPIDPAGNPQRIDVEVIPGEGVVLMPAKIGDPVMARVNTALATKTTGFSDLRALNTGELTLYFAHESDTGDADRDYARAVYKTSVTAGVVSVALVTDPTERTAAIDDPANVVIEQPSIRRVVSWEIGDAAYTELNDTDLLAIMERYAEIRAGAELVKAGQIELDGFHAIDPGDADGAITAVVYDLNNRTTVVTINQHEVPQSVFTRLEQETQRSLAAGLGRFRNSGSSAAKLDVRSGSSPGDGLPANAGAGTAELDPAQGASTRGADKAAGTHKPVKSHAMGRQTRYSRTAIYAVVTGATQIAAGVPKWEYSWEEVAFLTDGAYAKQGRDSSVHGVAFNRAEMGNSASGVQPDGVDTANLPGTYTKKPIGEGQVVKLEGPFRDSMSDPYWVFFAANDYDGECEAAP